MKAIIVILVALNLTACSIVGPGERGVRISLGKVSNEPKEPGAYPCRNSDLPIIAFPRREVALLCDRGREAGECFFSFFDVLEDEISKTETN